MAERPYAQRADGDNSGKPYINGAMRSGDTMSDGQNGSSQRAFWGIVGPILFTVCGTAFGFILSGYGDRIEKLETHKESVIERLTRIEGVGERTRDDVADIKRLLERPGRRQDDDEGRR